MIIFLYIAISITGLAILFLLYVLYALIKSHIVWCKSKAGRDYFAQQELKRHRERVRWHEYASRTDSFGNPM